MSSFWDRLSPDAAPASAPQQATQTQTGGAWWQAPALLQQSLPQPVAAPTAPPASLSEALLATGPVPSKAMSARSNATCPSCGSDNYFRPTGHPNSMEKCFECGYNARFAHSTAGAGMPSGGDGGPVTPSKQVAHGGLQNNFNPGVFINR